VKDENGDLLADSHNILTRWKNYFSLNSTAALNSKFAKQDTSENLQSSKKYRHFCDQFKTHNTRISVKKND
jgi:hypothetical protein